MQTSVGRYLVARLEHAGVRHVFGVAGDYVLDFMDQLVASPVQLVTTCNELGAEDKRGSTAERVREVRRDPRDQRDFRDERRVCRVGSFRPLGPWAL